MKLSFGLLFIAASIIHAESFPPKGFTEVKRETSPQETFQMIYFRKDPDEIMSKSQTWIQWSKDSHPAQLLFEYSDDAKCVVDPDERFIAANIHAMAGLNYLEIFVRNEDGFFQRKKVELLETALGIRAKQLKLQKSNSISDFDHINCSTDAWLSGGLVLCELEGNQGHHYFEWYFIYDAKKGQFLWDLSKINRR